MVVNSESGGQIGGGQQSGGQIGGGQQSGGQQSGGQKDLSDQTINKLCKVDLGILGVLYLIAPFKPERACFFINQMVIL